MIVRPIKLTYLITELDTGGAQKALVHLLAHIDRSLFDPYVICLYNGDKSVANEIRGLGIRVNDLKMTTRWRLDAFWRLFWQLRLEKPTILHTWMFHANIPGRFLGRLAGVPIIVCGERTMGQESSGRYWLNRITQRFTDQVVCVSEQVAKFTDDTIGIPSKKITIIPNGVDLIKFIDLPSQEKTRRFLQLPQARMLVGTIARLRPVKRVDLLLKAAANLEGFNVIIVGDGNERIQLESLASKLGILDRVHFAGYQENVRLWLEALDIFILTSDWEGMPNVILEAMAAGLPVVATDVGGTPEVVMDGETGFLVPPGDPDALAGAIKRLIDDPELRMKFGQAGRERIEKHFTIQETVRKTEELYLRLLAEKGIEV